MAVKGPSNKKSIGLCILNDKRLYCPENICKIDISTTKDNLIIAMIEMLALYCSSQ